jgi:hypothetical protein
MYMECSNPRPYVPTDPYTPETPEAGLQDLAILEHVGKWTIAEDKELILNEDYSVYWK